MFESDIHRVVSRLVVLALLVSCLALFATGKVRTLFPGINAIRRPSSVVAPNIEAKATNQQPGVISVVVRQLDPENGVIPVELQCAAAQLSAPNALDRVPCILRNNTRKPITAATIAVAVTINTNGNISSSSSFLTIETLVHADIQRDHPNNLIPPGGQTPAEPVSETYDNAVIEKVEMSVDYVEFADNATMGPDNGGSRIIADIRKGAAKYKNWLAQKYERSGMSLPAVTPLLER